MTTRSCSPRRGRLFLFTALALASSAACSTPQQQATTQGTSTTATQNMPAATSQGAPATAGQGTPATGSPSGNDCSTGPLLVCPEGQLDGCANGTTTEHRCVEVGPGRCLDIRAALVRCQDSEVLTHEGCTGPEYMKRCAPRPAQAL